MPNGKTIFGHCAGLITLQQRVYAEGGEGSKSLLPQPYLVKLD